MGKGILDQYAKYDYKVRFDDVTSPLVSPSWVGEHARRLAAYALLESYRSNSSRVWLEENDNRDDRREYGDPHVLVETTMASLLGDQQKVIVEGSLTGEAKAVSIQKALDEWLEVEKFTMKLVESERQSVSLGDSVFILAPDPIKGRPRLHVYDPGFYFPVFDPLTKESGEDFPTKVHIAYEFEMPNADGDDEIFVRRITWELREVPRYTPSYSSEATTLNCEYTDAYWRLDEVGTDMTVAWGQTAKFITEPTMMNIDFIPIVHMPNTIALQNHFGESTIGAVLQILDDIQATDTDLQAAASTTGTPPIAVSGRGTGKGEVDSYGPGVIFYVGDGDATVLDTSMSLDALLKLKDALLERLSVNSRTPEALLGRVKPNEVPSGIAMTLSFAPHTGMIKEMRLVRYVKYPLLFKFVLRMMGIKDPPKVDLVLGSFLPADKQETMTEVTQLYSAKVISLETAVQMLIQSGYPIESWVEEIQRIEERDVDMANALVTLSGDPNMGLERLGKKATVPSVDPTEE